MAVQTKADLKATIDSQIVPGGELDALELNAILNDMVDSYEDIIQEYTTVQRDALTPFEGQKIYNTTSNRLEYYSSSKWLPCSQKETVTLDASTNPNYPEGLVGDQYIITVAGFVGGGSGKAVSVGDLVYCVASNAGGNEGAVGTSWKVCYSGTASAQLKKATLTIASAQVLALNTTPQIIVPAVVGKAIKVTSGFIKATFNSAPYATNVDLQVINTSASATAPQLEGKIDFVANNFQSLVEYAPATAVAQQLVINDNLEVFVKDGNPTAGDSDITITVFYLEV